MSRKVPLRRQKMKIVRLLEQKSVIRFFGSALLLAPFVNTFVYIFSQKNLSETFSWALYERLLLAGTLTEKILSILGILLGSLMLTGSAKLWKLVLAYLGLFILFQIAHLGVNLRSSWIHGVFFLGNIGSFLFIADQLVWKQKSASEAEQAIKTPQGSKIKIQHFSKKIYISIPGLGKSGQILSLSPEKLEIKLDQFPKELKLYTIFEFSVAQVAIKAKVEEINHQIVMLKFQGDSQEFRRAISRWQRTFVS
jgi:hypothetical protein